MPGEITLLSTRTPRRPSSPSSALSVWFPPPAGGGAKSWNTARSAPCRRASRASRSTRSRHAARFAGLVTGRSERRIGIGGHAERRGTGLVVAVVVRRGLDGVPGEDRRHDPGAALGVEEQGLAVVGDDVELEHAVLVHEPAGHVQRDPHVDRRSGRS